MLEATRASRAKNDYFLLKLAKDYGVKDQEEWHNNNSTLQQRAYIIDLNDLSKGPAEIIHSVFIRNQQNGGQRLAVVPVAGWTAPPVKFSLLTCFSNAAMEDRLLEEYAQSFSLSRFTTAKNADVILRIARKAQTMKVFTKDKKTFFRVSAGVRITDADEYLHEKKLALPPNMPTLHVASLVGAAANGCYGPGRDFGPMTTNIVEMKVLNAFGERFTLSATEHVDLFQIFRDCHLGTCFVSEITFGNIQERFLMKRHNDLFKDVNDLRNKMDQKNFLSDEHFIAMYIPVDIQKTDDTSPRIRITTFEKALASEKRNNGCREFKDLTTYLSLMTTEAGEPLIDAVVNSKRLRPFFPFILKAAALKTFGTDEHTTEVDWSHSIAHVFSTYTDLPICDMNWLIQVDNAEQARHLLLALLQLTENHLKQCAEKDKYPLFNAFARYLKGIYYPEGAGGIAATATDRPDQSILSFELLTYSPLAQTPAFKQLVDKVVNYLSENGFKFKYHPGKTMPDNITSLTQLFTDTIDQKRLQNFKEALFKLHGGEKNLFHSPFLTPQKTTFIGLNQSNQVQESAVGSKKYTAAQKTECLRKILKFAEHEGSKEYADKARKALEG